MTDFDLSDNRACNSFSSSKDSGLGHSGSYNGDAGSPVRKPDPDSIKMFVGQVPKTMTEDEIKAFFSKYGEVYQLSILKDKSTGQSRGCCFVTFYTRRAALDAQNDLHNVKTMPGMQHPIQMKPADTEKKNVDDRKLFVGMLPRKFSEEKVVAIFERFGKIQDCSILRDSAGVSRGCAFVTFSSRKDAESAIVHMSRNPIRLEGVAHPLVVKFADGQKDKEERKLRHALISALQTIPNPEHQLAILHQLTSAAGLSATGSPCNQSLLQSLLSQITSAAPAAPAAYIGAPALSAPFNVDQYVAACQQLLLNGGVASPPATCSPPLDIYTASTSSGPRPAQVASPCAMPAVSTPRSMLPMAGSAASIYGLPTAAASLMSSVIPASAVGLSSSGSLQALQLLDPQLAAAAGSPVGKQTQGPQGANLFIYHLPPEIGDQELYAMFVPFGQVLSAKVFVDKRNGNSKCFGFVSYTMAASASQAIQAMNGFQLGIKRLKVQLKRPKASGPNAALAVLSPVNPGPSYGIYVEPMATSPAP